MTAVIWENGSALVSFNQAEFLPNMTEHHQVNPVASADVGSVSFFFWGFGSIFFPSRNELNSVLVDGARRAREPSSVTSSDVSGDHPTCFSHWDVYFFKKKDKLARAALLKEGNCACALCPCTCGKKKHITLTFFGVQSLQISAFTSVLFPRMQRPSATSSAAPPGGSPWLCERMRKIPRQVLTRWYIFNDQLLSVFLVEFKGFPTDFLTVRTSAYRLISGHFQSLSWTVLFSSVLA